MSKRKVIMLVICTIAVVLIASCGNKQGMDKRSANDQMNVQTVLDQGMAQNDTKNEPEAVRDPGTFDDQAAGQDADKSNKDEGIDVDLTALSATMVYSEVYNMMYYPENYVGKTVKMKGIYIVYHDEDSDKYYHGCVISDVTACCSQGIEFELTDDYKYPAD